MEQANILSFIVNIVVEIYENINIIINVPIERSVRLISNSGKIPLLHKRRPPREILGVFVCFSNKPCRSMQEASPWKLAYKGDVFCVDL